MSTCIWRIIVLRVVVLSEKTGEMLWRVLHDADYKPSKDKVLKSGEHSQ